MRISEAADHAGLSPDTIRYYERTGILPALPRGRDGHRLIAGEMLELLTLLGLLRDTGMPLRDMRRFTELFAHGNATIADRRALLEDHAERLQRRRARLDRCASLVRDKLAIYDRIEAGKA